MRNSLIVLFLLTACGASSTIKNQNTYDIDYDTMLTSPGVLAGVSAEYEVSSDRGFQRRGPATICYADADSADSKLSAMADEIIAALATHDILTPEETEEACNIYFELKRTEDADNISVSMAMTRDRKLSTATVTADKGSWRSETTLLRELALAYGANDKWEYSCSIDGRRSECQRHIDRTETKNKSSDKDLLQQVPEFIRPLRQ